MKTALVLGGTQLFGKRLVKILLQNGVDVTIATRGKTTDPFGDQVKRLIIEREDKHSIEKAVGEKSWDVIYDQSCFSSQEAIDAIEIFKDKTEKYLFTSTMAVYEFGVDKVEGDFDPFHYQIDIKTRNQYEGFLGYREAKRQAEAVLFQKASFPVIAVRFAVVVGPDDYTNRLKFHVDHVKKGLPIGISNPDIALSFISSEDAAQCLYNLGKPMEMTTGTINAASKEGVSFRELLKLIETTTQKEAIIEKEPSEKDHSPYAFPGSLTINNAKAEKEGITFKGVRPLLGDLIHSYAKE